VIHDARLTAWSLTGPAGGTITLRSIVPPALAGATVSVWVGGSAEDVDDLAGATEVEPVADGAETTWTVPVPVAVDPVALRWTVDGVPATVGRLVPSRRGTGSADVHVPLVVGDVNLSLLLPGAGPDLIPDDSLGILDPDTARQSFQDLLTMFFGAPGDPEEEAEVAEIVDGFAEMIPFYAPEQPSDVAAAIRCLSRLSGLLLVQLVAISSGDEMGQLWSQLNDLAMRVGTIESRRVPLSVQGTDPFDDGMTGMTGSMWVNTADRTVWVRMANGTEDDWERVWPADPPG
jgi:hypothetical protein